MYFLLVKGVVPNATGRCDIHFQIQGYCICIFSKIGQCGHVLNTLKNSANASSLYLLFCFYIKRIHKLMPINEQISFRPSQSGHLIKANSTTTNEMDYMSVLGIGHIIVITVSPRSLVNQKS